MRRKISLYIDNKLVDLDDDALILYNYTMDDLTNPAIVKNSYSQEVTLPGTPNNNDIFGKAFRLDRRTAAGFNALKRTPFVIFNEAGEVLERGYVKLNKISRSATGCTYSCSLFGGLGGFFYSLTYNEDGTKKTLADMRYQWRSAGMMIDPKTYAFTLDAQFVDESWQDLSVGSYPLISFAPCYNGLPACKFGANRAVYHEGNTPDTRIPNLYTTTPDGFHTKEYDGRILVEFANSHTEWEVQDLRAYLQRPVISVRGLLDAFTFAANTSGYTFKIGTNIRANDWYLRGWLTLPMYDRDKHPQGTIALAELLKGTATPADYLIGFAKMFGLMFSVDDAARNTIVLKKRNDFFVGGVTDLAERVHLDKDIAPRSMEARHYKWEVPAVGEFAKEYAEKYGKVYGSRWVNTGYDFNSDAVSTLEGIPFKSAPDTIEASGLYQVFGGDSDDEGVYTNYLLKFAFYEAVTWKLYKENGSKDDTKSCEPSQGWWAPFGYASDYDDFFSKVQLHGADNKAEDGANVLLFYDQMIATPSSRFHDVLFHLSDDTDEMLELNNGVPCYDISLEGDNIFPVAQLPRFCRSWAGKSWEFGVPQEVPTTQVPAESATMYANWWKKYIADRYDVDTKVVTCKVDLSGMPVDASLLGRFYFFDNSLWVMNKVINHSLCTYDDTECEFVQVRDMSNYLNGQY